VREAKKRIAGATGHTGHARCAVFDAPMDPMTERVRGRMGCVARWIEVQEAAPQPRRAGGEPVQGVSPRGCSPPFEETGIPRVTGIETQFVFGDLWMGMMGGSRKAGDLFRDPRMALHAALDEPEVPTGDARISGRAEAVVNEERIAAWRGTLEGIPPGALPSVPGRCRRSHALVRAVVDHLEIESWTPQHGLRTFERR